MRRFRWRQLGYAAGFLAFVATCTYFWLSQPSINWISYGRIQEGMTLDEVTSVLGKPPGDYSTRKPTQTEFNAPDAKWWNNGCSSGFNWVSDGGSIWVGFSDDGKAVGKHFIALR